MPKVFSNTIATGAKQFVVQEPLDIMLCSFFNSLLLTPWTIVKSTSFPGAEIITFLAPDWICFPAEFLSRKNIGDYSLNSIELRFYRPGDEKDIVDLFGIVNVNNKPRFQSWCRKCRNEDKIKEKNSNVDIQNKIKL